jgi:RHS repeat-associated protein
VYGADGQRVTKIESGVTLNYQRDVDGKLLVSYNGGSVAGPQELWVGGKHFGTITQLTGTTQAQNFSLTNWLGSEAVRTDPTSGLASSAYTSLPFGDQQLTVLGADTDDIHFTGKERDTESGLDYFGARYYASGAGRFMFPDWSVQEEPVPYAKLDNPQSLNLYSYVLNNPLSDTDADGHDPFQKQAGSCGVASNECGGADANHKTPSAGDAGSQAQQQSPYQAGNREPNLVYHETAALRPIPGESDDGDLHDARVDAANVYNNVTNKSAFQDYGTLSAREQKDLAGGYPPGVRACNDSVDAVNEAAHSADPTNGSRHFFEPGTTDRVWAGSSPQTRQS